MPIESSYWIKFHVNYLINPKFMKLPIETKWHFIGMYLLAKVSDAGGWIIANDQPSTISDIAFALHESDENISTSMSLLINDKFIITESDIYIINHFAEMQGNNTVGDWADKKREQTKIRVQNHRVRVREEKEQEEEKNKNKSQEKEEEKEGNAYSNALHNGNDEHSSEENDDSHYTDTVEDSDHEDEVPF